MHYSVAQGCLVRSPATATPYRGGSVRTRYRLRGGQDLRQFTQADVRKHTARAVNLLHFRSFEWRADCFLGFVARVLRSSW